MLFFFACAKPGMHIPRKVLFTETYACKVFYCKKRPAAISVNECMSPIADLEHKFGVVIDVDDSVKRQVAKEAAESGLGVRCLESKLLAMLEDEVFVAPDMCICQVKNNTSYDDKI